MALHASRWLGIPVVDVANPARGVALAAHGSTAHTGGRAPTSGRDGSQVGCGSVQLRAPVRKGRAVTDGLAILTAWVMFGLLLAALAVVVLTGGPKP